MVSYCSTLNDRLLTKRLIQISNCSLKPCHQFVNTSQWTDGLDLWSSSSESENVRKNGFSKRNMEFDEDIGLYLPRYEKCKLSSKNDFISSTNLTKNLFPKRLKQLFEKEKDLFKEDQQLLSEEDKQPSNSIQQSTFDRIKSHTIRFPFRHIQSNQNEEQICDLSNKTPSKITLKQQLNQLLTKETIHLTCKGTLLTTSSRQNHLTRSTSAVDSTSTMERYTKFRQVFLNSSVDQTTTTNKTRQSSFVLRGSSSLGLSVTPLAFSSSKTLQNCSSETISQSVSRSTSNIPNEDQQRIRFKRNAERGLISSSNNSLNKTSMDDQTQLITNISRHPRPPSKTQFQKHQLSQLLPTVISEKCLLIPIANHRHF